MATKPTVFVVDDDPDVRRSLLWLFDSVNLPVEAFSSGKEFLANYQSDRPGCLVLDIRMPQMDGLELLRRIKSLHFCIPTVVITGHGDVPMAVKAMKLGAMDFIEKPVNHQHLLETVQKLLQQDEEIRTDYGDLSAFHKLLSSLTPRELEVMEQLLLGKSNKAIAIDLAVGTRTVESHRAQIMEKLNVRSVAELVRLSMSLRCLGSFTD